MTQCESENFFCVVLSVGSFGDGQFYLDIISPSHYTMSRSGQSWVCFLWPQIWSFFTHSSSLSMNSFFCWSRWTFSRVSHDTFMCAHIGKVFAYGCCCEAVWVWIWTSDIQTLLLYLLLRPLKLRHPADVLQWHVRAGTKDFSTMGTANDLDECLYCCLTTRLANVKQRTTTCELLSANSIVFNQGKSDILPSGLQWYWLCHLIAFPARANILSARNTTRLSVTFRRLKNSKHIQTATKISHDRWRVKFVYFSKNS